MEMVIASKYKVIKLLGKGGMGNVYQVWDIRLDKMWAMKLVPIQPGIENERLYQQLEMEVNTMKKLDHPLLPTVVDMIRTKDYICMIMEYIEGITMEAYIRKNKAVAQEKAIDWGIELAEVLAYLHRQRPAIVYGDLKPANIMVRPDGRIKLIDFGTAMEYHVEREGKQLLFGTYGYAAPEQLQKTAAEIDGRCDIYALGTTLYHMVTGKNPSKPPYELQTIREVKSSLSEGLEKIIIQCTKTLPKERYQTCETCVEALKGYRQLERKQIFLKKVVYAVYCLMLTISAFFLGIGMEQVYLEKWNECRKQLGVGLAVGAAAFMIHYFLLKSRKKQSFILKQNVNVLLTEKKMMGLWSIIFLFMVLGQLCCNMLGQILPVTIKDENGRKILIREDTVFLTKETIIFELPEGKEELYQVAIQNCGWSNLNHQKYSLSAKNLKAGEIIEVVFRGRNPVTRQIRTRAFLLSTS